MPRASAQLLTLFFFSRILSLHDVAYAFSPIYYVLILMMQIQRGAFDHVWYLDLVGGLVIINLYHRHHL